jgi:signal peptidase I
MRGFTKTRRFHWFLALTIATIFALLLAHRYYGFAMVVGKSMLPTLAPHNLLLVDKRSYSHCEPQRGDIVLVRYRGEFLIKRVIGLPGEEVEVKDGVVYINDQPAEESDHVQPGPLNINKGKLLENRFAILGDNRSLPLPIHAVISREQIVGKVIMPDHRAK